MMEYSSSKKARLPGISFDFDSSDDDDSCCSSSPNNHTNIEQQQEEDGVNNNKLQLQEQHEYDGFASYRYTNTTNNEENNNATLQLKTPSRNNNFRDNNTTTKNTNTPHSSNNITTRQQRRRSSKSGTNKKISPTTFKLHTTANTLVDNTTPTKLDLVDDTVTKVMNNVVDGVTSVLSLGVGGGGGNNSSSSMLTTSWKKQQQKELIHELHGIGFAKAAHTTHNDQTPNKIFRNSEQIFKESMLVVDVPQQQLLDQGDCVNNSTSSGKKGDKDEEEEEEERGGGEQTAVLDKAAEYLARMARQYNLRTSGSTSGKDEEEEEGSNNAEEGSANNNGKTDVDIIGKEEGDDNNEHVETTNIHNSVDDNETSPPPSPPPVNDTLVKQQQQKQLRGKKNKKKLRNGKSSALNMALLKSPDLNTPYKKECIYNLVGGTTTNDNGDDNGKKNEDVVNEKEGEEDDGSSSSSDKEEALLGISPRQSPYQTNNNNNNDGDVLNESNAAASAMYSIGALLAESEVVMNDNNGPGEDIIVTNKNDEGYSSVVDSSNNSNKDEEDANTEDYSPPSQNELHGSSNNDNSTNNDGSIDEMTKYLMEESFYIGCKYEGFTESSSIHDSDISETDSEADEYCFEEEADNDEGDEGGGEDDNSSETEVISNEGLKVVKANPVIGSAASEAEKEEEEVFVENNNDDKEADSLNGWDDGWGDDDDPLLDDDDDASQPKVDDTVDITGIGDEAAKSERTLNAPHPPPTQNDVSSNGGNNESTASIPSEETTEIATPTKQLLPTAIANTTTSPSSSNKALQQQPPPPNSVHSTNSSQCDYIPSSLKQILSQQEDELSQLLTSIDALSSTPARIAKDVTDGMLNEDDLDEGLVDVVDMRNVSGGLRYGVGSRRGDTTTPGGGLSPVKKRLVMDNNNNGIDGSSTPMMDRNLGPLAEYEEEEEDVVDKQDDAVNSDAVAEEAKLPRETVDEELPSAPASAVSLPQSPAADTTTLPTTNVLEMKSPSTGDATDLNQSTAANETATPPLQRSEPVSSPPIRSPWLSWLSTANDSPTISSNSLQTPSPQQQRETEKVIMSQLSQPNDETAITAVVQSSDETAIATSTFQLEVAKLPSPSKDKVGDEEQDPNVPVVPSQEASPSPSHATRYQEDEGAKDEEEQQEVAMLTTNKSAEDNLVPQPDDQEDNSTDELEEDGIPDSIQQLFRDADSQLQNVLMSPVPTTSTTVHHDVDGVGTFCEDYIQPDSSEALPLSSEEEEDERRRLAEAAAQAELDRLEEERILEHKRTVATRQQRLKEEEEEARLSAERIEEERVEAEREEQQRRKEEEDARLLAEAKRAEEEARLLAKRIEEERVEAKRAEQQRQKEEEDKQVEAKRAEAERVRLLAERIEEERLEAERVEQQRRKEEEDARLLAETKGVEAERANQGRLERERLDAEQKWALEEKRQKEEETRLLAKAERVEKETMAAADLLEDRVADHASHDMRNMSNDDTFDTAMCSLGGIEKALDHFFDANDEVDDAGTSMDDGQGENSGGDLPKPEESNDIQHGMLLPANEEVIPKNEELSKSFEYNNAMEAVEEKKTDGDIDILDRVGSYMNKISGGCTIEDDANNMDVEKSVDVAPMEDNCTPSNDEVESQPPDEVIPTINGDDSRPSSTEQAISGVLDESMMNESMFMPNASSDSPESKESPPITMEPVITMSEDESDSEEDDDIEAFFPNRNLSAKPKAIASAVDKPKKSTTIDSTSLNDKSKFVDETKAIAPRHSKPAFASNQARVSSARSNVTSRVKRASSDREPITKPSSPSDKKQARRISSATLKRRERANNSLLSPPSTMKPAKKRSKSVVQVSSATTTTRRANTRSLKSPPSSLKPARKRSKPIVSATTNALPPANRSSTIRQMRGGSSNSKVVIRGKENNKVERIPRGKPNDKVSSTSSMKQSLVSMTKIRRQSESNLRVPPDQGKHPKKTVNMDRIERLAKPTRHRSTAKSTAELEEEEMRRIKPFKAKKICGSTSVPSRYKTATKREPSPPTPVVPSSLKPKQSNSTARDTRQSRLFKPTPVRKRVSTFGESVQHYLNHGLRSSVPSPKRDVKLTTPKPPSVAFLQRQTMSYSNVKTSEELELEECGKQFKARNYSNITHGRRTTMGYTATGTLSSEQIEMEECQKQFKARPLPGFGKRAQASHRRETPQREKARTLTTPSPFRLHTNLLPSKPPPISTDEIELQKKFRALPLPNASSTRLCNGASNTPFHIRAQQQYEMARNRHARTYEEEETSAFKAKPLPKTTYKPQAIEKPTKVKKATQPKPPRLSLMCRAEERKIFDQHADELRRADNEMKELREQQQREYEEQEIRRKRHTYADDEDDPGFCFRARQISIEYTDR